MRQPTALETPAMGPGIPSNFRIQFPYVGEEKYITMSKKREHSP